MGDFSEFTGAYLETVDHNEIFDYFRDQIEIFTGAGPDLIAIETIPALDEAKIILDVLQKVQGHPPVWISFTCKVGSK